MALPPGIETVTLTGSYTHPGGTAMRGTVRLKPTSGRLVSATTGLTVQGEETKDFDGNGDVSITVVASDATGINPSGGTYQLTISFYDAESVSFPVLLPQAAPTVKLAAITPVTAAEGEYVVVTGPAGPPGSEADAEAYTDAAVAAHTADTTAVHGIADTTALETGAGATAKVGAHTAASDPHGDRAWASGIFATITALDTTNGNVITLDGYLVDIFARIAAIEGGTAFLGGVNSTGPVRVIGADLSIEGTGKGYRFRRGGGGLDLEATGADFIVSNWGGPDFTGTQRSYFRLSADAQNAQVAGRVEFVDALYGATRHVIDGAANTLGFHGATPIAQQTVAGSWADGTAGASLAAALDALGLIDDQTTA